MFKEAICLTHYSADFIKKLEMLGYKQSPYFKGSSKNTRDDVCICTSVVVDESCDIYPVYCIVNKKTALSRDPRCSWVTNDGVKDHRLVTDNEDLAFAIATLKDDDNDKNQYFTIDCNWEFDRNRQAFNKGTLVFCTRDKWNLDFDNEGNPSKFSSRNVPAHKSTKEEILEFFKKGINL